MKITIDESEMAMALLNGLLETYTQLTSSMDALHGEENDLNFDKVKSRFIQEEQRIKNRIGESNT